MATNWNAIPGLSWPTPNKLKFRAAALALIIWRLMEPGLERGTTYYFSQAGNDTTGDGSINTPWKTIAKAQTVLSAHVGGDIRLRFRRGDTWSEAPTGNSNINLIYAAGVTGLTIDDYLDASAPSYEKPYFNGFRTAFSGSSGWTDAGNGRYTRTVSGTTPVHRVRYTAHGNNYIFIRATSDATVEENNFSFWHDTANNLLHVRTDGAGAPSGVEINYLHGGNGITIQSCDNVLIQNIRMDGYGAAIGAQMYGVYVAGGASACCVVRDSEVYMTGYHAIGSSGAGKLTVYGCRAGYCEYASGTSIYNFYNSAGGHEFILAESSVTGGRLPGTGWVTHGTTSGWWNGPRAGFGFAAYGHTSGGSNKIGFGLVWNVTVEKVPWGVAEGTAFSDVPTFDPATEAGLADCRVFVFGERLIGLDYADPSRPTANTWKANCFYDTAPGDTNTQCVTSRNTGNGVAVNTLYRVNNRLMASNRMPGWLPNGTCSDKFYHCHFEMYGDFNFGSVYFGQDWIADGATKYANVIVKNSVIAFRQRGGNRSMSIINNAANIAGNAYCNHSAKTDSGNRKGYSADTSAVEISTPVVGVEPTPDNPLYRAGVNLPWVLEYDANWRPRNRTATPTIGPVAEQQANAYDFTYTVTSAGGDIVLSSVRGDTADGLAAGGTYDAPAAIAAAHAAQLITDTAEVEAKANKILDDTIILNVPGTLKVRHAFFVVE